MSEFYDVVLRLWAESQFAWADTVQSIHIGGGTADEAFYIQLFLATESVTIRFDGGVEQFLRELVEALPANPDTIEAAVLAERERCGLAMARCIVEWENTDQALPPDQSAEILRRIRYPRWDDPDASDVERGPFTSAPFSPPCFTGANGLKHFCEIHKRWEA